MRPSQQQTAKMIGWLLAGVTLLPFLIARAEACDQTHREERLARLLALHDARELIYIAPVVNTDRAALTEESRR